MPWGEEYTGATLVDMYLAELAAHRIGHWHPRYAAGCAVRLYRPVRAAMMSRI